MTLENRILVAFDFSFCSEAALFRAIRVGGWFQAPVTVLHVVAPFSPVTRGPLSLFAPGAALPTEEDLVESAHKRWEALSKGLSGMGDINFVVEIGSPRDRILEAVRRDRPRLLVVGAHGKCDGFLGVGPVAAACVQRAATQVLVVRQKQRGAFRSIAACVDFGDTSLLALEAAAGIAAEESAALHIVHAYAAHGSASGQRARSSETCPTSPLGTLGRLKNGCTSSVSRSRASSAR